MSVSEFHFKKGADSKLIVPIPALASIADKPLQILAAGELELILTLISFSINPFFNPESLNSIILSTIHFVLSELCVFTWVLNLTF